MTPERSQSPTELSNSEEDPTAPTTSSSNQIRVKNVSEINSNEAETAVSATNKRKLPSWMLVSSSNNCKKTRTSAVEGANLLEESNLTGDRSHGSNDEIDVNGEAAANGDAVNRDEQPESSHCSVSDSVPNESNVNSEECELTSSTTTENAHSAPKDTNSGSSTNGPSCSSDQKPIKHESEDDDDREAVGLITPTSPKDVKPAVKVEKGEATSSTTRVSCKYGIRCYRRNPMHRIEEAHPGDNDYTRPDFPPPPDGTPPCPFGSLCYRRNPTHFQSFSHPPSTDFAQNRKNYKMRLRQRRNPPPRNIDMSYSDTDSDDSGDFTDDDDLDDDFIPSDLDD